MYIQKIKCQPFYFQLSFEQVVCLFLSMQCQTRRQAKPSQEAGQLLISLFQFKEIVLIKAAVSCRALNTVLQTYRHTRFQRWTQGQCHTTSQPTKHLEYTLSCRNHFPRNQHIFNYRLSQAQIVVECPFGMWAKR